MKLSYRWLARHVDLAGIPPQDLAQDLTLSTCEVEGLERFLPHLHDVVVGLVQAREKHPDADKLSRCTVDVGDGTLRTIVCGASNVAAGQKVAVALPGTELPGGLKIKKSKIRGVESEGMICSERELGLGEEHSGIWVLPAEAPLGRPVDEVFTGWPARIVQHETDHLDGTLYLDRAELRSLSSNQAMAERWTQPTPDHAAASLGFALPS